MKLDLPPLKPRVLAVRTIPDARDDLARGARAARRAARAGHHHDDVGRRAVRGARSGDQGVARRRRVREVVLRRRRTIRRGRFRASASASTPAAIRRRSTPRWTPASPTWRTRPGSTPSTIAEDPDRPVALFPHVIASVGPLPGAAGRHRGRQPAGVPDRAAAGVGGGPGRRVQGGARAHGQVVRPAVGDELRRRLPGRRSAVVRGGGARVRGRDRRRVRGAAGAPVGARRRREHGASRRARRRPTARPRRGASSALDTGERFTDKPDHLTHLVDDASLVPKTHPRIVARGKLDLLQSALLDAQVAADADGARSLVGELGEILELARALVGAEVTGREVPPPTSVRHGLRRAARRDPPHPRAVRRAVHVPGRAPGPGGREARRWRAASRARRSWRCWPRFRPTRGAVTAPPARADLAHALNRISSALYLLACRYVAGLYEGSRRPLGPVRGWKPPEKKA